ncbi:hypothetical protein [Desertivirga xinjiangensis]|uniref:hypothetical protein n=1 Tax=Desertivirga xinjiangensis TaxID=539206 RepID=UPI00210A4768|nr:hypothetical protein [Pedobacter xinjiangensis]
MKRIAFVLLLAVAGMTATAQTKPAKKAQSTEKKEECKKTGGSCCSPTSKAKALLQAKPATQKKG